MDVKRKRRIIQIFNQLEKYDIELSRYSPKEIIEAYEEEEQRRLKNGKGLYKGCSDGLVWVVWSGADMRLDCYNEEGE